MLCYIGFIPVCFHTLHMSVAHDLSLYLLYYGYSYCSWLLWLLLLSTYTCLHAHLDSVRHEQLLSQSCAKSWTFQELLISFPYYPSHFIPTTNVCEAFFRIPIYTFRYSVWIATLLCSFAFISEMLTAVEQLLIHLWSFVYWASSLPCRIFTWVHLKTAESCVQISCHWLLYLRVSATNSLISTLSLWFGGSASWQIAAFFWVSFWSCWTWQ